MIVIIILPRFLVWKGDKFTDYPHEGLWIKIKSGILLFDKHKSILPWEDLHTIDISIR